ncbi:hypothetical protein [Parachlamydia acanthamoebae]|jgi:hypothetical protein|uniref:hypothetical protein n=1 Tax=Parachlamydia acanthamoebae TaxID=83552 RepID=UPI0001C17832|nr:hypothetical protein [Parachlamydia acanthamoebae]EFB42516.1 hypothetical protein pah_c005o052 [Parachlamydia acanthamoebae str. Hall's coccus]
MEALEQMMMEKCATQVEFHQKMDQIAQVLEGQQWLDIDLLPKKSYGRWYKWLRWATSFLPGDRFTTMRISNVVSSLSLFCEKNKEWMGLTDCSKLKDVMDFFELKATKSSEKRECLESLCKVRISLKKIEEEKKPKVPKLEQIQTLSPLEFEAYLQPWIEQKMLEPLLDLIPMIDSKLIRVFVDKCGDDECALKALYQKFPTGVVYLSDPQLICLVNGLKKMRDREEQVFSLFSAICRTPLSTKEIIRKYLLLLETLTPLFSLSLLRKKGEDTKVRCERVYLTTAVALNNLRNERKRKISEVLDCLNFDHRIESPFFIMLFTENASVNEVRELLSLSAKAREKVAEFMDFAMQNDKKSNIESLLPYINTSEKFRYIVQKIILSSKRQAQHVHLFLHGTSLYKSPLAAKEKLAILQENGIY